MINFSFLRKATEDSLYIVLTCFCIIAAHSKVAISSVFTSENTMTCMEFYTEKSQQANRDYVDVVQYIFDKDIPIYNMTEDLSLPTDFKCIDGKCSVLQRINEVNELRLIIQNFHGPSNYYNKYFYNIKTLDLSVPYDSFKDSDLLTTIGILSCDEPLPEIYLSKK